MPKPPKTVSEYMKRIGTQGGASKSDKKSAASRANAAKAREAKKARSARWPKKENQ